jgi:hypothetical protein
MTLAEKNQSFFQKHHKLLAALLAVLLPYAGFNGYQEAKKVYATPAPAEQSVTVNVASMPEETRTDRVRSNSEINALIDASLAAAQQRHDCRYHAVC